MTENKQGFVVNEQVCPYTHKPPCITAEWASAHCSSQGLWFVASNAFLAPSADPDCLLISVLICDCADDCADILNKLQ